MAVEMNKIIEISLAKIENSKTRKVTGRSSLLHRSLLVNSLLNRVRSNDKDNPEPLMNYREPKSIDMELDEQDLLEKCPPSQLERPRNPRNSSTRKQSGLISTDSVTMPPKDSFSTDSQTTEKAYEMSDSCCSEDRISLKDNIACECKLSPKTRLRTRSKRPRLNLDSEESLSCPNKKLKSIQTISPSPKVDATGYSVTSLASLFSGLVANSEAENSSLKFSTNYVTVMMAC